LAYRRRRRMMHDDQLRPDPQGKVQFAGDPVPVEHIADVGGDASAAGAGKMDLLEPVSQTNLVFAAQQVVVAELPTRHLTVNRRNR